jgi:hypothetical protein
VTGPSKRAWPQPDAVLCGLEVAPEWRGRMFEQRLLGCLREELAQLGPTELVTISYLGPEAEQLKRLGFHGRVTTVRLLTIRP